MNDKGSRAGMVVVLLLAAMSIAAARPVAAGDTGRVNVTVDKTEMVAFVSAVSRVSVSNPMIADVHVVSPMKILVNGKTPGTTSLVVFRGSNVEYFDVVVYPAPTVSPRATLRLSDDHAVEVQRAGIVSQQLFVRDADEAWVPLGMPQTWTELGTTKSPLEGPRK